MADPIVSAVSSRTVPDPLISLHGVGVSFRRAARKFGVSKERFWALEDLSFELYPGEVLGIIGRNASGKSTLLRLLAGILRPDRGEIRNFGVRLSLLSLRVGFARHLSGRQNIILSGLLLGVERKTIEAKVNSIIEFAELTDWIDDPISTYSSGMTARLGFAIAYQMDPEVLLIDEVMGVGDLAFAKKSASMLREKIQSDRAVVLVSHNAKQVMEMSDRVIWIEQGRARMIGDPGEVTREYEKFMQRSTSPRSQASVAAPASIST